MNRILIIAVLVVSACSISKGQTPLKRDSLRRSTTVLGSAPTKKDMVVISQSELPEPLRNTLQAIEYQGWEKGKIYRTKLNDMFMVEIKRGNKVQSFHFDVNGKPLDP